MATKFDASAYLKSVEKAAMGAVIRGTQKIRNEVVRSLTSGGRSGRIYKRRQIVHQASAPGEPPASDTGALVGSITTEFFPARLAGRVTVRSLYGAYLEFGTRNMEPRPYMRPTVALLRQEITDDIRKSIQAATKGTVG